MQINSILNYQTNFQSKNKKYDEAYITDHSGRFYAGMTIEEAIADGTDKSFWHRDFYNLDKNNDGILSVNEILKERRRD